MRARAALVCCFLLIQSDLQAQAKVSVVEAFPALKFEEPVDLTYIPATHLLAVVERKGRISAFTNSTTTANSKLVLDISTKVQSSGQEQGLLGVAFDPKFKENGYLFANYTFGAPTVTRISRFKAKSISEEGLAIDPASERVILEFPQPYSNHNGGQLAFGNDGFLYIASGDGGSAGDPHGNGQSLNTLLGKILRIDVSKEDSGRPYAIPKDNPFIGHQGVRPEIFAFGLRNPWRFSFNRKTGEIWAGDVGQNELEEIDIVKKGANYGWSIMEGTRCFKPKANCKKAGLEMPVTEYGREEGASVIGGYIYRGTKVPVLKDRYIYADFVKGKIWAIDSSPPHTQELLIDTDKLISSFGEDSEGELYFLDLNGKIFKLGNTQN